MINYSSNVNVVIKAKLDQVRALKENIDPLMREVVSAMVPELRYRVHTQGKDSNGGQIGTYSPGYMKIRTGNYNDAAKFKKGGKKGEFKEQKKAGDAGSFSKGQSKGGYRPTHNRFSADTDVILSLTRQMENDLSVVASGSGYGIGYLNSFNLQKARWCEATYKKKILSKLTKEETALAVHIAHEESKKYIK